MALAMSTFSYDWSHDRTGAAWLSCCISLKNVITRPLFAPGQQWHTRGRLSHGMHKQYELF